MHLNHQLSILRIRFVQAVLQANSSVAAQMSSFTCFPASFLHAFLQVSCKLFAGML
jgi:hypothetical protein